MSIAVIVPFDSIERQNHEFINDHTNKYRYVGAEFIVLHSM